MKRFDNNNTHIGTGTAHGTKLLSPKVLLGAILMLTALNLYALQSLHNTRVELHHLWHQYQAESVIVNKENDVQLERLASKDTSIERSMSTQVHQLQQIEKAVDAVKNQLSESDKKVDDTIDMLRQAIDSLKVKVEGMAPQTGGHADSVKQVSSTVADLAGQLQQLQTQVEAVAKEFPSRSFRGNAFSAVGGTEFPSHVDGTNIDNKSSRTKSGSNNDVTSVGSTSASATPSVSTFGAGTTAAVPTNSDSDAIGTTSSTGSSSVAAKDSETKGVREHPLAIAKPRTDTEIAHEHKQAMETVHRMTANVGRTNTGAIAGSTSSGTAASTTTGSDSTATTSISAPETDVAASGITTASGTTTQTADDDGHEVVEDVEHAKTAETGDAAHLSDKAKAALDDLVNLATGTGTDTAANTATHTQGTDSTNTGSASTATTATSADNATTTSTSTNATGSTTVSGTTASNPTTASTSTNDSKGTSAMTEEAASQIALHLAKASAIKAGRGSVLGRKGVGATTSAK